MKSPPRYNPILYEIGQGTHDLRRLESKVGVRKGGLGPYLETLREDLALLQMENPVCGVRRQARYVFDDPFFYFHFVFGSRPLLELGRSDRALREIEAGPGAHAGVQFERIALRPWSSSAARLPRASRSTSSGSAAGGTDGGTRSMCSPKGRTK